MRKFIYLIILILLISVNNLEALDDLEVLDSPEWIDSYSAALLKAKEEDKPIMIDVYANWCKWCKVLDQQTYSDSEVISKSNEFINAKVNGDHNKEIVMKYQVSGYPTLLFIDSEGNLLMNVTGFVKAPDLLNKMETVLKLYTDIKSLKTILEKDADDIEANFQLAEIYILQSRNSKNALPLLQKVLSKDPNDESGHIEAVTFYLGYCYTLEEDFETAVDQINYFLKEYPNSEFEEEARFWKGMSLYSIGNKQTSLDEFKSLKEDFPQGKFSMYLAGIIKQIEKEL